MPIWIYGFDEFNLFHAYPIFDFFFTRDGVEYVLVFFVIHQKIAMVSTCKGFMIADFMVFTMFFDSFGKISCDACIKDFFTFIGDDVDPVRMFHGFFPQNTGLYLCNARKLLHFLDRANWSLQDLL